MRTIQTYTSEMADLLDQVQAAAQRAQGHRVHASESGLWPGPASAVQVAAAMRMASRGGAYESGGSGPSTWLRRIDPNAARWTSPDVNGDGVVNAEDAAAFFDALAGSEVELEAGALDFNRDGVFPDAADVEEFVAAFAQSGGWSTARQAGVRTELFVDPIRGDDANSGTPDAPLRSIPAAIRAVPRIWPTTDWRDTGATVYLACELYQGQEISQEYDGLSWAGGAPERCLTVAAWDGVGRLPRPIIAPRVGRAGVRVPGGVGFVRLLGLHFRQPPGNPGSVIAQGSATFVYAEDCVLDGGAVGVAANGMGGSFTRGVVARRCTIQDTRHPGTHAQGAFVSAADILFDSCAFVNCGNRDTFCHDIYGVAMDQEEAKDFLREVRNCWFDSPGFCGVQARANRWRVVGNVFNACGNALGIGHPMSRPPHTSRPVYVEGEFERNLIVDPAGPSWSMATQGMNSRCRVHGNVSVQAARPGAGALVTRDRGSVPSTGGQVFGNIGVGLEKLYNFVDPFNPQTSLETYEDNVVVPLSVTSAALRTIGDTVDEVIERMRARARGEWNEAFNAAPMADDARAMASFAVIRGADAVVRA